MTDVAIGQAGVLTAVRPAHIDYLDGWRGLAILSLLIGHFFPVPGINLGHVGVNLFFVLSGLLMTRLLFEQDIALRRFYKRRISRVFPALYIFVLVTVLWSALIHLDFDWLEVPAALLFFRNYYPADGSTGSLPLGHLWSLCVEEHSYILLACMAFVVRRYRFSGPRLLWLVAALCACCAFAYGMWGIRDAQAAYFLHSEVNAFGIFIAGALLLTLRQSRMAQRLPSLLVPLFLTVGVMLYWWSVPRALQLVLGTGAFALALNLLSQAPSWFLRLLSCPPLRQLGLWSFSIYLWQQPFYLAPIHPALGALGALAAGLCSFYLLEQPARVWLNRAWAR